MIGSRESVSTPAKLRTAVIKASKLKPVVTVSREVLESAGLLPGSADLSDWIDALPGIQWSSMARVLTINFEDEGEPNG